MIHQLSSCDICNIYFLCVKEKGAWFCGLGCYLGGNDMKRWFSIFTRCSKRNTCIKLLNFEDLFSNMTYFQIIFYSNSKESYFAKNGFTIYFLRFLEPTIFNLYPTECDLYVAYLTINPTCLSVIVRELVSNPVVIILK